MINYPIFDELKKFKEVYYMKKKRNKKKIILLHATRLGMRMVPLLLQISL